MLLPLFFPGSILGLIALKFLIENGGVMVVDTDLVEQFRYFSDLSSIILVIAGFLILLGWAFDISILKSPSPGFSTIKTNVAVALIFAGLSLWLLQTRRTRKNMRSIAQISAIIVTLLGFLTLIEYLFGINLGIDQIFFKELPGALYTSSPNRMSISAAVALFFIGSSLLFLSKETPRNIKWSQIMALIGVFVIGLPLIGFLYGSTHLYYIPNFTGIAFYAVLLLFWASLSILFARPDNDFVYRLTSNQIGSYFTQRILPVLIIFTIGMGFISVLGVKFGLYDASFGISLIILSTLLVYSIVFLWFTSVLNKIDLKRDKAEVELGKYSEILEDLVEERTEKLVESEERFRALFDNANDMISLNEMKENGLPGNFIEVNKVGIERLGYSREEFLNMTPIDIVAPDKHPEMPIYAAELQNKGSSQYENVHLTKDGKRILVEVNNHLFEMEGKTVALAIARDITERKKIEEALLESEKSYREIVDSSLVGVYKTNLNGDIIFANEAMAKIGHLESAKDLKAQKITQFYKNHEDRQMILEKLKKEGKVNQQELEMVSATGETVNVLISACLADNTVSGMIIDITERKKAEKMIKNSLEEKEMLLKEIHHRVKNNLQIISSLLDLQEDYVKEDPMAVNVLKESQNRVLSMALIHEMLYQSKDLGHIDFSAYIRNLVSNLFGSYGVRANIQTVINVEEVFLNIETSIPLGLIISELVSNSLKYAFPDDKTGELIISLDSHDKEFELIISDDGVGLPEVLDFKKVESSLGLRLVNSLANQLDGTIELDRSHGTKFTIKFKELKYKKRI